MQERNGKEQRENHGYATPSKRERNKGRAFEKEADLNPRAMDKTLLKEDLQNEDMSTANLHDEKVRCENSRLEEVPQHDEVSIEEAKNGKSQNGKEPNKLSHTGKIQIDDDQSPQHDNVDPTSEEIQTGKLPWEESRYGKVSGTQFDHREVLKENPSTGKLLNESPDVPNVPNEESQNGKLSNESPDNFILTNAISLADLPSNEVLHKEILPSDIKPDITNQTRIAEKTLSKEKPEKNPEYRPVNKVSVRRRSKTVCKHEQLWGISLNG